MLQVEEACADRDRGGRAPGIQVGNYKTRMNLERFNAVTSVTGVRSPGRRVDLIGGRSGLSGSGTIIWKPARVQSVYGCIAHYMFVKPVAVHVRPVPACGAIGVNDLPVRCV